MDFGSLKGKWALITGASAGIGEAIARELAAVGMHLMLTARREDRLKAVVDSIKSSYSVDVESYIFDVRDRDACESFAKEADLTKIYALINNAGLAMGFDSIQNGNPDHWDTMIDTNIKGLLYVSRAVLPELVKNNDGFVINIGSLAGYDAYAKGAVYCGTKFAVRAINEAMKKDVHGTPIRVAMIAPGLVETEFSKVRFEGDEEKASKVYHGFDPLTAKDIAEITLFTLSRPAHVNILESLVMPTAQSASTMVDRG